MKLDCFRNIADEGLLKQADLERAGIVSSINNSHSRTARGDPFITLRPPADRYGTIISPLIIYCVSPPWIFNVGLLARRNEPYAADYFTNKPFPPGNILDHRAKTLVKSFIQAGAVNATSGPTMFTAVQV